MDLHPISVPNSVLTDNLNGTLITYDGNEHVLQNDMGNYKLKDCQLKPNYIPIGLKEYAGILYIVSYNPLDEHVEIGTYPSPEIKTFSEHPGSQKELQAFENLTGDFLYSEIEKAQSVIWYDEKLKIHPGDFYKLTTDLSDTSRIIRNVWYIMTDDKTLQEIEVKQNTYDFVPVTWEYPGYLTFQSKIITPTEFDAFVSQLNIPNYIEDENSNLADIEDGKIGFELTMSKNDFAKITKDKSINETIRIDVTVTKVNKDGEKEVLDTTWGDGKEVYTIYDFGETEINIFGLLDLSSSISNLKKTDSLIFEMTPVFKDDSFSITFDQYKVSTIINFNKIGTIHDLKIGSEVYKFWRKNDTCYVIFDIDSPTIVAGDVHLWYRLMDLNENVALDWTYFEDEVLSGENMLAININDDQKEQIYILEFCLGSESKPDDAVFNKPEFKKILITSVVFNEFVGTHSCFDKEITFPEWYKLHDKYANYNPKDFVLNVSLDDYVFNTNVEKELINKTNERYWNTTSEDASEYTYSLAIKNGDENPQLDYTFGYLQENIHVDGDIKKLNDSLLNYGVWKIPEKDIQIQIGNTSVTCKSDHTFSSDKVSCLLAKNVIIDTVAHSSAQIPSVDKVFVNRGLTLEQTVNGTKTILKNQQLVGHQYGAGAANSSEDLRQYGWAAENIVTSVITMASKLSVALSAFKGISHIAATSGIVAICSMLGIPGVGIVIGIIAGIIVAVIAIINVAISAFSSERHLPWASSLYTTNIETTADLMEQFDKTATGTYQLNEKFKNSLSLSLLHRGQGIQWNTNNKSHTSLESAVQSLLQKNQSLDFKSKTDTTTTKVYGTTQYSCFPVLFQEYATESNGWVARDGICIYSAISGGDDRWWFASQDEFNTFYSVWIAFMSPSNNNTLIYTPCKFKGLSGDVIKAGSISNCVDKKTGAPTDKNGIVSENNEQTVIDVSKMVASAMVWCRNLFVVPENGTIVSANFMEPVFPDIPENISLVFEYKCVYDYTKSKYLGKTLIDNRRVSLYNLSGKVENLNLLEGSSVILKTKTISNKYQTTLLDSVESSIGENINTRINLEINKYKNFSQYCTEQGAYNSADPVITENTIRNGIMKGVYNTIDKYDPEGGLLYELNMLSNLKETLTCPPTNNQLSFALSKRTECNLGTNLFIVLGQDSGLMLDCSESYYDLSAQ